MGAQIKIKKTIFFDLYGTLIDIKTEEHDPWIYEILSKYLSYHSVDISPNELHRVYFEEIEHFLNKSRHQYPEVDVYRIFSTIMYRYGNKRYSRNTIIDTAMFFRSLTIRYFGIFSGIYDVLASFNKKYKTGIISDAQWVFAEPEMAMLGLDRFFKLRILSSRFGFKKPDVRLFNLAMDTFRVSPAESVYIGDNPYKDLIGARMAGIKCILFRSECKSYNGFQPDGCFYDYSELENLLHEIM